MISIQDLCVGNWVYDGERTQFPMYVQTIGEDYVYLNFDGNEGDVFESTPEELRGIPLTEQLLMKIGFKNTSTEGRRFFLFFKIDNEKHLHLSVHLDKQVFDITEINRVDSPEDTNVRLRFHIEGIKFIHELQNLFFLTTKKQLTINL